MPDDAHTLSKEASSSRKSRKAHTGPRCSVVLLIPAAIIPMYVLIFAFSYIRDDPRFSLPTRTSKHFLNARFRRNNFFDFAGSPVETPKNTLAATPRRKLHAYVPLSEQLSTEQQKKREMWVRHHVNAALSHIDPLLPLTRSNIEEAFGILSLKNATSGFGGDDAVLVKIANNTLYIRADRPLQAFARNCVDHMLKVLLAILRMPNGLPDLEAIFAFNDRAWELLDPPRAWSNFSPVFAPCGTPSDLKQHVILFPRWHGIMSDDLVERARRSVSNTSSRSSYTNWLGKRPEVVFRGTLSGKDRLSLFRLASHRRSALAGYADVEMVGVAAGAPCLRENTIGSRWCTCSEEIREGLTRQGFPPRRGRWSKIQISPLWRFEERCDGPFRWAVDEKLLIGSRMSFEEQSEFRYMLVVDGVGCADRLSHHPGTVLAGETVLFWHKREMREFWWDDLEPYIHYVPVAEDFSDLVLQVRWANTHPEETFEMRARAARYATENLHPNSISAFIHALLTRYGELFREELEPPDARYTQFVES
ncbi:hypothetical protein CYMTET_50013 [Cymbomonas tetramitiformis]|uniref:Glycosyl transferase CAP10 domain-containing protein n=1 Tax=Cymbomonas tetramitiformis TaxID=36881 RepID=A0AAE0BP23_9CHLO|nr:hypothetical protein CYMTET_50013 [Cymbomonas tetramitiformis]